MARYPGTERERRIEPNLLKRQVAVDFTGCGMSCADASSPADSLMQADLRSIHSHGVLRVPNSVAKLTHEGVNPRGRPRVVTRTVHTSRGPHLDRRSRHGGASRPFRVSLR